MSGSDLIFTFKNERFEADYVSFGSGKDVLVILPGLSLTPVSLNALAIKSAYSVFEEHYTVYLFERRKEIPEGFTLFDIADDTAGMMRGIGIKSAFVFGVSMGGMVSQLLAARYPELVRGLALASTLSKSNGVFDCVMREWGSLARRGENVTLNRSFFEYVYSKEYREKYAKAFAVLENSGTPEQLARFANLTDACRGFDASGELEGIACKSLVLGGADDKAVPVDYQRELASALHAKIKIYGGYAHAVYDEAPGFKEDVLHFFDCIGGR